jgi:hypothetical protein
LGRIDGVVVDAHHNLYIISDANNSASPGDINAGIVKVTPDGALSIVAGYDGSDLPYTWLRLSGIAMDANHHLYAHDWDRVLKVGPRGNLTVIAEKNEEPHTKADVSAIFNPLCGIEDIAVDASGHLYVAGQFYSGRHYGGIVKVAPDGTLSIVAGNGEYGVPVPGPAISSPLSGIERLARDAAGNLYAVVPSDPNGYLVVKVSPAGMLSIIAGNGKSGAPVPGPALDTPLGNSIEGPVIDDMTVDAAGNLYLGYGITWLDIRVAIKVMKLSPDGILSVVVADL